MIGIGLVGAGFRSGLATAAEVPGESRVVAVADVDERAARRAVRERHPGAGVHTDHRALLGRSDVDAVLVITPDNTHADLACDALEAGKAVFVEKPLATTVEDCDRVLRTAEKAGSRLYVGHNMRHMPVVRTMREIVERGDIGAVQSVWVRHFVGNGGDFYFKDWHAERRCTTSLLLQKAAHDIDVVHWLAGAYTERVSAFGALRVYGDGHRREPGAPKPPDWLAPERHWPPRSQRDLNPVIDVEDLSLVNLQLGGGVLAAYQQCHFTPDYWRNYTVIGDAGRLENFGDGSGAVVKVWNRRRSGYAPDADAEHVLPPSTEVHAGADRPLMAEFLRFVRDGGRTDTSPVAARMSVAAGVQATASLRAGGKPHDVPPLDPQLVAYFERGQRPL
ncbi:Gfo/Idh/MocA family oxidoreductase [Pseudonocardia sp. DSM 110487]|uniref:Gfo/Idh/MocA family protein n=1 Tax=Pseudonocardia sp. DSM 110487 TaxID=2865833 RepID=UPI001C6A7ECD|nr:Gfo/Idh/MocA family oxidoreductase [Pseudonocardia sp. DSM 110487]QYN33277.1 Gfo/Idh/MocA family oxidoreductase [Pseudonocardia sp. DSM 110487]